jgi:MYXO-CTERM domain-containing protein
VPVYDDAECGCEGGSGDIGCGCGQCSTSNPRPDWAAVLGAIAFTLVPRRRRRRR